MRNDRPLRITIGIKALNEERRVAEAIESALAAIDGMDGEVILADSGSSDRTVEIARAYPIRVVQLGDGEARCCGAGAQLAFQNARGEYFYILDGDMSLDPDFIRAGIAWLEAHPKAAAVGGNVREMNTEAAEFEIRANEVAKAAGWRAGPVDRLDCGGLYRVAAIREVGWFADRNLHAFEEFELGARLVARGWTLERIDRPAVDHYGHQASGYALLLRRFRSGYAGAPGEVLRAAIGQPHLGGVTRRLSHIGVAGVVTGWWLALLAALVLGSWPALAVLLFAPFLFLSWRRGSARLGLFSLVSWNVTALGFYGGFLRRRADPSVRLADRDLSPDPLERAAE